LLNDKFESKISDFGISKILNDNITTTITQKGTPIYQSPEQFPQDNKPIVGKPADIYGFGSIIYEVIFETLPWSLEGISRYFNLILYLSFDELYKAVVIDKKRPKIPNLEGI
jgi:serine/threonine protein kinase